MEGNTQTRDDFLKALSNYSECIRPFLRTAQDRYIGQFYMIEEQPFDFKEYCKAERLAAEKAKDNISLKLNMQ